MPESIPLRLIPLGGLGEIGMNCMAVELGDRRILLDCGVTFDDRGVGVDVVHPSFDGLEGPLDAIVLTHGHEDHIGAIPYLLARHGDLPGRASVPIYGPPYALALVKERLAQHEELAPPPLHPFSPGDRFSIGPFDIEPYRVTHSLPDCTGLILRTPHGVVVHSGDFKIDDAPTDGQGLDTQRLERLRDEEGVRLLLSDSTNAITDGWTGREEDVAAHLLGLVRTRKRRVVVTAFASNVHRLRALAAVAKETGRKLCLLGRSLEMHARLAVEHGHLPDLTSVRVERELARTVPPENLLVVATGTQGEPAAALARLGEDRHPDLTLEPGDTVIHSARIIPGREAPVYGLLNTFERRGIEVIFRVTDPGVHVSGHAHRDEQRRLIELLAPQAFMPVHGTYLHLKHHAEIARGCGVEEVLLAENGAIVLVDGEPLRTGGRIETGRVHRRRGNEVPERAIKDRSLLAELGVAVVTVLVDRRGRPIAPLSLLTRGVLHEDEAQDLLDDACDAVDRALNRHEHIVERPDEEHLERIAKRALKRFFAEHVGHKPLCYAVVMRAPS